MPLALEAVLTSGMQARGQFVRIRGDVISRVLGEHVVDAKLFATIYERQIHNPRAFAVRAVLTHASGRTIAVVTELNVTRAL